MRRGRRVGRERQRPACWTWLTITDPGTDEDQFLEQQPGLAALTGAYVDLGYVVKYLDRLLDDEARTEREQALARLEGGG